MQFDLDLAAVLHRALLILRSRPLFFLGSALLFHAAPIAMEASVIAADGWPQAVGADAIGEQRLAPLLPVLVSFIVSAFHEGFCLVVAADWSRGERTRFVDAATTAGSRFIGLAVARLIAGFLTLFGCCAFIVGGFVVGGALFVAPAALMYENHGSAAALQRSHALTTGRRFPAACLFGAATLAPQFALVIAAYGAVLAESLPLLILVDVVGALWLPVEAAVKASAYFELRGREQAGAIDGVFG